MANLDLILVNFLSPPVLFYFVGILATVFKSDLEFPQPLPKLFSLYLLFAIGIKGGVSLGESGFSMVVVTVLVTAVLLSIIVPLYTFFILRLRFNVLNSAAICATYGSISAVTFITAGSFLETQNISYGGYLVTAMALMEVPAIVIGVALAMLFREKSKEDPSAVQENTPGYGSILKHGFLNGSVLLLISSLLVGMVAGEQSVKKLTPLTHDLFYGVLCFFLLDMGMVSAGRLGALRSNGKFAFTFALVVPLVNAMLAIGISVLLGLSLGDSLMLTVLAASASYIAVPAALRLALPEANTSLYVPMSLAITFPFNIILGIPLYFELLVMFGVR